MGGCGGVGGRMDVGLGWWACSGALYLVWRGGESESFSTALIVAFSQSDAKKENAGVKSEDFRCDNQHHECDVTDTLTSVCEKQRS